jgi:hypothetical protein
MGISVFLLAFLATGWAGIRDDVPAPESAPTEPAEAPPVTLAPDPATSRYLYAPSALPLGKGRWYFSQKELFFSGVATGVTKHVSVLVGSIVPALLFGAVEGETDTLNGIVAIRGSVPVGDNVWIGSGAEIFGFLDSGFALPFVNAKYGVPDHHITVGSGAGIGLPEASVGFVQVVMAAAHRVSEAGALITENWFIIPVRGDGPDPILVASAGWRFIAGKLTEDLALVNIVSDGYIPLPWLDIAYHWGGGK